jgi:1-aminocyclopropane-1-carboxylate deaminase
MDILNHLTIPSPLHQVSTVWSAAAAVEIYMKRDDLIHPIISGNKWRKLSGILGHYDKTTYREIITFGGAFSNHLVATAASCAILKIPCKGIIRGEEPKQLNGVLKLCEMYGMRLTFVTREEYKEHNRQLGVYEEKLFIPEGGACEQGTLGCFEILKEIELKGVSRVFVACGTGTTIAGMSKYMESINDDTLLCGIQVLKGNGYIAKDLQDVYGIHNVTIYDEFHCGGYAKTSPELMDFIKEFTAETGILLDPVYTGKMMLAIKKLCVSGDIKQGDKVIAIHTGGLTGWFGKVDEL